MTEHRAAPLYDIGTIVAMLRDGIEPLARELLPNGRAQGNEWVDAHRAAGGLGDSFKVNLRTGVFGHFAAGKGGDALDLVAYLLFAGDKKRALAWSRRWLGIDGNVPREIETQRLRVEARQASARQDDERRSASALAIFLAAKPLPGTPSEAYLRGRGINFAPLGRYPGALRHHAGLVHPETGEIAPALVAAIVAPDGRQTAVHRTFLEPDGAGGWRKLSTVENAKLSLGRVRGGCIRLWRGGSGRSWRNAPAGEWVVSAEGIEDAGSAVMAAPEYRTIAAVSLANMGAVALPSGSAGVIVLAQNDPPESDAALALKRAIRHFHQRGLHVRLARPPAGVKDINELLQHGEVA